VAGARQTGQWPLFLVVSLLVVTLPIELAASIRVSSLSVSLFGHRLRAFGNHTRVELIEHVPDRAVFGSNGLHLFASFLVS
jgi:hypothetical protein